MRTLTRRRTLTAAFAAGAIALALGACSPEEETDPGGNGDENGGQEQESESGQPLDVDAYEAALEGGPVADEATIDDNEWASAVRDNGVLEVGGTETNELFSLLNTEDGVVRGFDAGLSQALSRYILGEVNTSLSQVNVDTREEVLVNGTVDVVFATYSITPERAERIDFAGPYYATQSGVLVAEDNEEINGVEDLAGMTVATQAASTGVGVIEEFAPEAEILELPDNAQAVAAVQQGRADAYVIDYNLLLSVMATESGVRLAGDPFGPEDFYGIGVPKDSDALEFVNTFLQEIYDDGTWDELWQVSIGDRAGIDETPQAPEVGSVSFD